MRFCDGQDEDVHSWVFLNAMPHYVNPPLIQTTLVPCFSYARCAPTSVCFIKSLHWCCGPLLLPVTTFLQRWVTAPFPSRCVISQNKGDVEELGSRVRGVEMEKEMLFQPLHSSHCDKSALSSAVWTCPSPCSSRLLLSSLQQTLLPSLAAFLHLHASIAPLNQANRPTDPWHSTVAPGEWCLDQTLSPLLSPTWIFLSAPCWPDPWWRLELHTPFLWTREWMNSPGWTYYPQTSPVEKASRTSTCKRLHSLWSNPV